MRLVTDAQPEQPQRPAGSEFARARAARTRGAGAWRERLTRTHPTREAERASQAERVREVTGETVAAANATRGLSDQDVRVVFAQQVFANLDGGRAAILRPERRRALVAWGTARGLRPFDANLVIAIVQDAARRGEVLASVGAVPAQAGAEASISRTARGAASALVLIPEPRPSARREVAALLLIAAVLAVFLLSSVLVMLSR